jgi:hypothetical protein
MKKIIFYILLLFPAYIFAREIPLPQASNVAINWMNERFGENFKNEDIQEIRTVKYGENPVYYVVIFKEQGWVIVASDDVSLPVIAYSNEGKFSFSDQSPAFSSWMNATKKSISQAIVNRQVQLESTQKEWEKFSVDINRFEKTINQRNSVTPLLSTKWNQDNGYNDLCPKDFNGPNGRAYAGCVATAMAQVMKYYNFPAKGFGTHSFVPEDHPEYGNQYANFGSTTYNWNSMSLTSSNTHVALLIFHCAVSVDMNFGPDGSGANTSNDARNAFTNNFKYDESISYLSKEDYTSTDWQNLLIEELNAGRPILYDGRDSTSGHAFICDGNQTNSYFHFNWGWGGYHDGYFYLNDLTPGSNSFNLGQGGLFYIKPSVDPNLSLPYNQSFEDQFPSEWKYSGDRVSVSTLEKYHGIKSLQVGTIDGVDYNFSSATLGINVTKPMIVSFKVKRGYSPATSQYNEHIACIKEQFGTKILHTFFKGDYNDNTWQNFAFDLSPYVGQNLKLYFEQGNMSTTYKEWMFIDAVNLEEIDEKIIINSISNKKIEISKTEGAKIDVNFKTEGDFYNNTFTVYLSDTTGSFTKEKIIGYVKSDTGKILTVNIPKATPSSSKYKIRIKSSTPKIESNIIDSVNINFLEIKIIGPTDSTYYTSNNTGSSINIPINIKGEYTLKKFKAFLSDKDGNFTNENEIGVLESSANNPIINAKIPKSNEIGTKYRIRIKCDLPAVISDTTEFFSIETLNIQLNKLKDSLFYVSPDISARIEIPFILEGNFPENKFAAYLSDANGSFINKNLITLGVADTTGVFIASIPAGTISGENYKIILSSKGIIEIESPESNAFVVKLIDTRPSVIISAIVSDSTFLKSIPMTLKFNNGISGFEESDIILTNCKLSDFTKINDTLYNFNIIPKQFGMIIVSIPENSVSNILGNGNLKHEWQIRYYSPVGIQAIDDEKLNLFPNPSSGIIYIDNQIGSKINKITIKDLNGNFILSKTGNFDTESYIDLTRLPKASYIIEFSFNDRQIRRKLIIN